MQMKPKVKVDATSLKRVVAELQKFEKESGAVISQVTQAAANQIRDKAMSNVRTYGVEVVKGVGEIVVQPNQTGLNYYSINVQGVPMAAYLEFGTGAFVKVEPEWKGLAWQFYVNGKGALEPHPYLYPAFRESRENYQKTLENAIEILTKRYSS